jgi:Zn-dependent peptidase ImmA (M78 family)
LRVAVWSEPVTAIAESFGVSDKAIEQRCKRLGIVKPPRGYWAKIKNGISHKEALFELGWLREEIEELGERLAVAEENVHVQEVVPIPD